MTVFSLEGRVLKLNTRDDAKPHLDELDSIENLSEIRLSGNTFGIEAGKAFAEALKKHTGLKRAILSDMFTGRLKTEIPPVLEAFVEALIDKRDLVELDLSDNAFGPAGAEPLQKLIIENRNIQVLRLNNNGLGIGGGKLIAAALTECALKAKEEGKESCLKVIICGRNRLESEGAGYLAKAFELHTNLVQLRMPQNSIRPEGIQVLMKSLSECVKLEILDVQDNTFTLPGCQALADALPSWPKLKELNIGECLLGAPGAKIVIRKLTDNFVGLEKLLLSYNEIDLHGAEMIPAMLGNKKNLVSLELNGNAFLAEEPVVDAITDVLRRHGNEDALDELDDMEVFSDDEEEDEEKETADAEDDVDGLTTALAQGLKV